MGTAVPRTLHFLMQSASVIAIVQDPLWWTPIQVVRLLLGLVLVGTLVALGWAFAHRNRISQSDERFRYPALYDSLTGVSTRLALQAQLYLALEDSKRHQTCVVLLMVGLDDFKVIALATRSCALQQIG